MADPKEGENPDAPQEVVPPATSEQSIPDASTPLETPDPSTGTDDPDDGAPKSMAEAIERALAEGEDGKTEPKAPEPAPTETPVDPAAPKEPEQQPVTTPAEGDDDPTEAELKALRPQARKRVTQLLSQRNGARRELADVSQKWEADKADAGLFRQVNGYLTTHRITGNEFTELLDIGRKLKSNDPQQLEAALGSLLPLTLGLMELTGRRIPADIQAKLADGEISEAVASDMAKARARALIAERQSGDARQQQQVVVSQTQTNAVRSAVDNWEATARAADPDWKLKADLLASESRALIQQHGLPRTPEQAVEYAQFALKTVNDRLLALRPKVQPTRGAPSPSQTGNRAALRPAPKSLAEAIQLAVRDADAARVASH